MSYAETHKAGSQGWPSVNSQWITEALSPTVWGNWIFPTETWVSLDADPSLVKQWVWLKPQPTCQLQPHEKLWARTTHYTMPRPLTHRNYDNVTCSCKFWGEITNISSLDTPRLGRINSSLLSNCALSFTSVIQLPCVCLSLPFCLETLYNLEHLFIFLVPRS